MSLNWKEINLVLDELQLEGLQIQKCVQSAYDILLFELYGEGLSLNDRARKIKLMIALTPGACRMHATDAPLVKTDKPLRFAEFCKSHLVGQHIEKIEQLGDNRIVQITTQHYYCYIRLWSNAANVIVTDKDNLILDCMRRSPKRGEITGKVLTANDANHANNFDKYQVREYPAGGSFNQFVDKWYSEQGNALSLDSLRDSARKLLGNKIGRLDKMLERLLAKEAGFEKADELKTEADELLSSGEIKKAQDLYARYKKAKSGIEGLKQEIEDTKAEIDALEKKLEELLTIDDPLVLNKALRKESAKGSGGREQGKEASHAGLAFAVNGWTVLVGRNAKENDELLRRKARGNDLWMHVRDYAGGFVFIKYKNGKSFPLEIMLNAGNLALFYSKARNNGEADLFYTQVKYLRRLKSMKNGRTVLGKVIPTQEKNLHIKQDTKRLHDMEKCRV
ncbi:MAG: NFACT RNA binding domain-containing protein [Spirochaetaceae bacterium]|jgi:predicted ribosome quality control (RQC) complex YloA/Tae2 family protein|nr:NFACT RNA binding domain-containing protein [Spirochaetaceae bacterium]